jgi:mono/diheme cytochrome c family protein
MSSSLAIGLVVLALLGAACGPGPDAEMSGEALFRHHCVSCHGPEGRGDGPLANELRRRPADLTGLARAAGGDFDAAAVKEAIDGRRSVQAHGPRDMPVWGVVFGTRHVGEPFYVQRSDRELDALVEYVRSLQAE